MLDIVLSNKFKRDLKLAKKRGCNIKLLQKVVDTLAQDHELNGEYRGFRECHIEPDWLLIYRISQGAVELFLFRTGTHSDLF